MKSSQPKNQGWFHPIPLSPETKHYLRWALLQLFVSSDLFRFCHIANDLRALGLGRSRITGPARQQGGREGAPAVGARKGIVRVPLTARSISHAKALIGLGVSEY